MDAYRKALAGYDPADPEQERPEAPETSPWQGDPWCLKCHAVIRAQLGELDDLTPLRTLFADGYSADTASALAYGGSDPASPSPGADDAEDTYQMLAGWEDAYRGMHGWPSAPRRGILAARRTTCIAWLADHLDAILISDLGADFGLEVMRWHRDLKARSKGGKRTLHKPLRCPSCQLLALTWDEGEQYVQCAACGAMLTYDEYEACVERAAAGAVAV
jgi:ribosomal protein S27E